MAIANIAMARDTVGKREIGDIEELLDAYEVPHLLTRSVTRAGGKALDLSDELPFYEWFLSEEPNFELLWERLTDETFHILFRNRSLLLAFNQALPST